MHLRLYICFTESYEKQTNFNGQWRLYRKEVSDTVGTDYRIPKLLPGKTEPSDRRKVGCFKPDPVSLKLASWKYPM